MQGFAKFGRAVMHVLGEIDELKHGWDALNRGLQSHVHARSEIPCNTRHTQEEGFTKSSTHQLTKRVIPHCKGNPPSGRIALMLRNHDVHRKAAERHAHVFLFALEYVYCASLHLHKSIRGNVKLLNAVPIYSVMKSSLPTCRRLPILSSSCILTRWQHI